MAVLGLFVFFFATQYNLFLSSFVPNFRILNKVVAEKSLTEKKLKFSFERKKNEQIKGLISNNMWLFFVFFLLHTIQLITIKLCTKFQNPRSSSC